MTCLLDNVKSFFFSGQLDSTANEICFEENTRYRGHCINCKETALDYHSMGGKRQSMEECFELCKNKADCNFYSWKAKTKQCFLQRRVYRKEPMRHGFAGRMNCSQGGKN